MADKRRGAPRQPRAHWFLLGLLLLVIGSGLLLDGYRTRELGGAGTGPAPGAVSPLAAAGPILDLSGPDIRSTSGPDKTVALTFDDGPDPRWTPAILALLHRHHVPATFFVVGSRVLSHPGLVRAELHAGDEIGSHTFSHINVTGESGWQSDLELSLTQSALASAAGIHTALFRPPYSSEPDAATLADVGKWRAIARQGYLVVVANRDTEDWRRPGVEQILANAQPLPGHGTVVMFHDGGGDRSETVAAADRLITELSAKGYRFVTVTGLAGLPPIAGDAGVGRGARLQGRVISTEARVGRWTVIILGWLAWPVGLLVVGRSLLLVVLARYHRKHPSRGVFDPDFAPPVSVVVPAYNEGVGIGAAVRSLAAADYPTVEVVVVDDGSTDDTAQIVEDLALPNTRLIRQPNGGKAAALNTGIAAAAHDIIVTVDGDTLFEPDTLRWLVQPLADPRVGAVSGNTKVANRKGILGRWQHVEYVMGFNLDRRMYDLLDCMPTVPGAIGCFRREIIDQVGGFATETLAEDTDITMAIGRAGWRIAYADQARAWTEAPASLSDLWKQRYRWSYGTMQALWKHRGAVRERTRLGWRGFPFLVLFQVVLPLLSPVIDLYALFGIVYSRVAPAAVYWLGLNALNVVVAAYALHTDGESMRPAWVVPLQQFVYRQLVYLVIIQAAVTAVLGSRLRWQKLDRTGDFTAASPPPSERSARTAT